MKLEKPAVGLAPVALKMMRTATIPSTTRKIKPMKFCRRRKRFRAALRRLRTNGDCPSGRAAGASVGAPAALVRANRSRPSQRGRAMGYTSNPRTQVAQRETRRPSPILRGRDRQSNSGERVQFDQPGLGAWVTGLDFSSASLGEARELVRWPEASRG